MKVSADTIARTICLGITLANAIFVMLGKDTIDIAEDTIYEICSGVAVVAAGIWSWWKNNSFTRNAIEADETLAVLKEGVFDDGEGDPEASADVDEDGEVIVDSDVEDVDTDEDMGDDDDEVIEVTEEEK